MEPRTTAPVPKTPPPNKYSGLVEAALEAVRGDCFNAESTAVRRKLRDCLKDLGELELEQ